MQLPLIRVCACAHFQAAMKTCEATEQDIVYTNGSTGHVNIKEVTKIREVAFEKHPSEPLVPSCLQLEDSSHLRIVLHGWHRAHNIFVLSSCFLLFLLRV